MGRTRILRTVLCSSLFLFACEDGPTLDGPEQVLKRQPSDSDADQAQSPKPWALDEGHDFEVESGGDSVGRARFCDDAEAEAQVQEMINAPILPDQGLGKLPLWGEDFTPLLADDLLGSPADGKFCDPSGSYADAFTFGPLAEIVVIFDQDTRLVTSMYARKGYLGTLEGKAVDADGQEQEVWIRPGDPIRVGDLELKDDNPNSTAHWLHPDNINLIYRMLRGSFFPGTPAPEPGYDCLSSRICRVLEVGSFRALRVEDSGVIIFFPPQGGAVDTIILTPVRVAPFEASGVLTTGATPLALPEPPAEEDPPADDPPEEEQPPAPVAPAFESGVFDDCKLSLDGSVTFKDFRERCVKADSTLSRASYSVSTARDSVSIDFNGIFLSFLRKAGAAPLQDGERPADDDVLYSIAFTDNLNGPFMQWVPKLLGGHFKARLEALVRDSLYIDDPSHPFASFSLGELPDMWDIATQLSPVVTMEGQDLVKQYVAQVQQAYAALTPEQRAYVDPALEDDTYLIGEFVKAAMSVITGGATDAPGAVVRTIPSDDALRITGRASFVQDGQAFRVATSYNRVFGGMVYIVLERGFSAIDAPINAANALIGNPSPYYAHYLSLTELELAAVNPFALGASMIEVTGVDRKLGMLSVKVTLPPAGEGAEPQVFELNVPGDHLDEGAGFSRQIEGETAEFIPSHRLDFFGKETALRLNVDASGVVQRVTQATFKGPAFLCGPGGAVRIYYGDDVRATLDRFSKQNPQAFRACGIVYNYSPNKNVLDSVVSVIHKVGIIVSGGRAVSVDAWQ